MATDLNSHLHQLQGKGMTNERVNALPTTELDHLLSAEFF